MKKQKWILLALMLVLGFSACGHSKQDLKGREYVLNEEKYAVEKWLPVYKEGSDHKHTNVYALCILKEYQDDPRIAILPEEKIDSHIHVDVQVGGEIVSDQKLMVEKVGDIPGYLLRVYFIFVFPDDVELPEKATLVYDKAERIDLDLSGLSIPKNVSVELKDFNFDQ